MPTDLFADYMAMLTRIEARLRRRIERQTAIVWHAWNLPTAGDMRRLLAQNSALEARVRDLSARLDESDREREAGPTQPVDSSHSAKRSNNSSSARGMQSATSPGSGARKSG